MKELNPEIDTTKFVNIDDKKFVFHINKQPREIEAGEEKIMPVYVAQLGAKHLTDKILQEKGIPDSNRDTPIRRSILAQILPDVADEVKLKPLSEEEFKAELKKEWERQEQ